MYQRLRCKNLKFICSMILIRKTEQKIEGRRDGLIGGPVHLGVGQESSRCVHKLNANDRVFVPIVLMHTC